MRRALSCLLLVLVSYPSHGWAAQAAPEKDAELAAFLKIEQRVQAAVPRPAPESATKIHSNGYWEALTLDAVRYRLLDRTLTTMRTPDPEVVAYWVGRAGERDGRFTAQAVALIKTLPPLAHWAGELQRTSEAMAAEALKAERISTAYYSLEAQENAALKRTLDLPGKRQALARVVREMLAEAGELDPAANETWRPIYGLLESGIQESVKATREKRAAELGVRVELRKSFFGAVEAPGLAAHYEKLAPLDQRLAELDADILEYVLQPGQTPMACFSDAKIREYADTLRTFDRDLVQALDSPAVKANPDAVRVLYGLFPIWRSLDRYHAFLQHGRRVYALALLIEAARTVLMAASWQPEQNFNADTGAPLSDFIAERAGHTVDLLQRSQDTGTADRLYAAVAIDEEGAPAQSPYAWVTWKWLTASDVEDLKLDQRIVDEGDTHWILPAGSRVKTIAGPEEARAAAADRLLVAVDPEKLGVSDEGKAP